MIQKIIQIAKGASKHILDLYNAPIPSNVDYKSDNSPLTQADRASHQFIVDTLPAIDPKIPVISEESMPEELQAGAGLDRFWVVDPLDGTKEFVKRTGEFTVNIALIEKGEPVLGVVHVPVLDLTFAAEKGKGAWRTEKNTEPLPIRVRDADFQSLIVVASRDHAGPQVKALLEKLPGAQCTSMGSSLKFCLVAEGKADLYLRDVPTMEWDTAAAQCIVEAAGGRVMTLDGKRLLYGKPEFRNPPILTVGDAGLLPKLPGLQTGD